MWKAISKILNKDMQSAELSSSNKDGKVLKKDLDILEALHPNSVSVGTNLARKITSKPEDDCLKYVTISK